MGAVQANPGMALPRPEALFASMGAATYTQNGLQGVIHQQTDKAILNWRSFDIGPQNSVEFQQPAATSIALNRINERANPSQILGELKANGQVYLYNPNGFVFGANSRVNVNTLVATSLNISDEVFERGITKVFDDPDTKGNPAFVWTGAIYDVDHLGPDGKPTQVQVRDKSGGTGIKIEAGAQLSTTAPNRRILIVAPVVENHGTVQADDGEVILAAAKDKLYLQEAPSGSSNAGGLLVEVGAGGAVNNLGSVSSRRGNITLAGFAVNQNGMVTATTSVRQNGTIRLLAREGGKAVAATGRPNEVDLTYSSTYRSADQGDGLGQIARVTLGPGSVTQVQPEYGDPDTAIDEQAQPRSKIEMFGKQVRFESNSQVLAPSGGVTVTGKGLVNDAVDPAPRDTRIDMAAGSRIDVSGLDNITVPMERNVVEATLRGNELRDAPLQRDGILREQTIRVDIRRGTPLADISPVVRRIGRTIEERSTAGGTVTLDAPGAVVVNQGAVIDISGGEVRYDRGHINTSMLITNGRVVDIHEASPNLIYDGILGPIIRDHSKWSRIQIWSLGIPGMRRDRFEGTYTDSRDRQNMVDDFIASEGGGFEEGYIEGKDAGSLSIVTEALKLDGLVNAVTKRGVHQRTASTVPEGGELSIDLGAGQTPQNVLYASAKPVTTALGPNQAFPGLEKDNPNPAPSPLVLAGDFQRTSGIVRATIKTAGRIDIAQGATVSVPEFGALSLSGGEISVAGMIDAPGAEVNLATREIQVDASLDGTIDLTAGSVIDVGGTWVNDRSEPGLAPDFSRIPVTTGGSIAVDSWGDINLGAGSELSADGGAWLKQDGTFEYGPGGRIDLKTNASDRINGYNLALNGLIHAYSPKQGGSLAITTNEIVIGHALADPEPGQVLRPLLLGRGFFSAGGFSSYSVTSNLKGVTVASGTPLLLRSENLELSGDFLATPFQRSLEGISRRTIYPVYQRYPVDLTLALRPPLGGLVLPSSAVKLEAGSSIVADPMAEITFVSERNIDIAGTIQAPGGNVSLNILAPSNSEEGPGWSVSQGQGIFLRESALLDARGESVIIPDRFGFRYGEVLSGGNVSLLAQRGYIVAASGSRIDVSGSSDQFHLPTQARRGVTEVPLVKYESNGTLPLIRVAPRAFDQPTAVSSNGGSIDMLAAEGILLDGELAARPGGDGAVGGSLSLALNTEFRNDSSDNAFPSGGRILSVQAQDTQSVPVGWTPGQDIPMELNGIGQLAAETVKKGGFESLSLESYNKSFVGGASLELTAEVRFQDSLSLDLRRAFVLDAPVISWGGGDGVANINATVVSMGSSRKQQFDPNNDQDKDKLATSGPGALSVTGGLIDLYGATSLQGFSEASFSSRGDLRLRGVAPSLTKRLGNIDGCECSGKDVAAGYLGELQVAGNLNLGAVQIYPTTASTYTVNVTGDDTTTLNIQRVAGTQMPVLSAGGELTLAAPNIVQSGVLRAPFGAIQMNADHSIVFESGSLTSTSGGSLVVPFGRTPGGLDWLYPMVVINEQGIPESGDANLVFDAPPETRIALSASKIALNPGATIDISGGGDLGAFEFVSGLGGSIDLLDPRDPRLLSGDYRYQTEDSGSWYVRYNFPKESSGNNGTYLEQFAVLPSLQGGFAPYDHLEFPASGLSVGDNVYLAGGNGLSEGEYTLLPPHYALLPGAFLVTPTPFLQTPAPLIGEIQPGMQVFRTDGARIVAGYRKPASSGFETPIWNAFAVEPSSAVRERSSYRVLDETASAYQEQMASVFFDQRAAREDTVAARSVNDAGRLILSATQSMELSASVLANPANGGRGGQLDITSDNIAVVAQKQAQRADGAIELLAANLNHLGMESIVLGASRTNQSGVTRLTVRTKNVAVETGAILSGPELILAAKNQVSIENGATVAGEGRSPRGSEYYELDGDAALVRVSSGSQAGYAHGGQQGTEGDLSIQEGANVRADGSMLLDSSRNTLIDGRLSMDGGDLAIYAGLINLGQTPAGTVGATLSDALLAGLTVDNMTLTGRNGVNLYGALNLKLGSLVLDTPTLTGKENPDVRIVADAIRLTNSSGANPGAPASAPGRLALIGDRLEFGPGTYALAGFDRADLQGSNDIRFSGEATLFSSAATRLLTAQVSGADGAEFTVDATGFDLYFGDPGGQPSLQPGLVGHFTAKADNILKDPGFNNLARFKLPSGVASFTASQSIALPSVAVDLAGLNLDFGFGGIISSPGGFLNLTATNGAVEFGGSVDVSGGSGASSGGVTIAAPNGVASLNADLKARSGSGAFLKVDAQTFANGFSGINQKAQAGGFDGSLSVRQRSGDLTIAAGETVRAGQVSVSADQGSISVLGGIDASGASGGNVVLSAGNQVVLESGAKIQARSTVGKGGSVELASSAPVAAQDDDQGLVLKSGSTIDVSGATGGGSVRLRATRNDQAVSVAPIDVNNIIAGADDIVVEAVKVQNSTNFNNIGLWKNDTATFMNNHATDIAAALGGRVKVQPGLEIRSAGDLVLNRNWDLFDWRYQVNGESVPGFLTIRAGGNLTLTSSLSDGFDPGNVLQTGSSWDIRLISGADFGADWRQTNRLGTGNLTLSRSADVRTGTGDIDILAGGNITLSDQNSAIYTAGRALEDIFTGGPVDPNKGGYQDYRYGNITDFFMGQYLPLGEFPEDGGDIRIAAGGHINGAKSTQFAPDWQRRMGSFVAAVSAEERKNGDDVFWERADLYEEMPTSWAIQYDFKQNVGALGGGDVTVSAGGDILNLQVAIPTSGKQVGEITEDQAFNGSGLYRYVTNEVKVNGGGDLIVLAGGDILGGQFQVDRGTANITALGKITGGTAAKVQFESGPLFAIGDADFAVTAAQGVMVGAAYSSSVLAQAPGAIVNNKASVFFSEGYGEISALRVRTIAGDIDFRIDTDAIAAEYPPSREATAKDGLRILPGTLDAITLLGDITLRTSFDLFPSSSGNLSLIAGGDIESDSVGNLAVNMAGTNPALFPSINSPKDSLSGVVGISNGSLLDYVTPKQSNFPVTPLHLGDSSFATLFSLNGEINGNGNLTFFLPKPARIFAARDVADVGLSLENMRVEDVSIIQTGRDLRYRITRGCAGQLQEPPEGFLSGIDVKGPGQLHVLAGRDIDLGISDGISTSGNLNNPFLAETGASMSLLAGLSSKPLYQSFLQKYLTSQAGYALYDDNGKAIVDSSSLSEDEQREAALTIFFDELKESGLEAAEGLGYERGNRAIEALFPSTASYDGDIKLFFSRIHTLDGGNIDLLAPGGLINVGLASAFAGEKGPDELGIVTQRGGAVLAYTEGDIQVNLSRIFANASQPTDFTPRFHLVNAQGESIEPYKDIILWSALGDIDAGRGSQGPLSASIAKKVFDPKGNLTDDVPPTIDGSGIRAQSRGSYKEGDVYLAAPQGRIIASEAPIGGGNVTAVAQTLVGTNFQSGSGGVSSNVATSTPAVPAAPAAASSAAAAATQMAQQSAAGASTKEETVQPEKQATTLSILSADLVGFGNYSISEIREGKFQPPASAPPQTTPGEKEEDRGNKPGA